MARNRGGDVMEKLPEFVWLDIMARLDLESLCSAAPVCRALRSLASQSLASITTLDLSGFSPSAQILNRVLNENKILCSLTLDCRQLDDSSVEVFTKEHLEELVLLKCSMFTPYIFTAIGENCSKLRLLKVETVYSEEFGNGNHKKAVTHMLMRCVHLESLCLKILCVDHQYLLSDESYEQIQQKHIKALILQPLSDYQVEQLIKFSRNPNESLSSMAFKILSLSLVLNRITNEVLISISRSFPHLAELCLEDEPPDVPLDDDLSNSGLEALGSCRNLTRLSLTRSKKFSQATFKAVNDFGILVLVHECEGLESVRLGGFSKVTDAGFGTILLSCKNLKRFEIIKAASLSDLAFHDLASARSTSIVEVRLVSCNLLTSQSAISLTSCRGLEVLDLSGCRSVAGPGLRSISRLCKLTSLDLGGADITDRGLLALGGGSSPITSLCLRGCKRITDRGIDMLMGGDGIINLTLSALDLGYLPGVSDRAIATVVERCTEIADLCIRHCFAITDASIETLGRSSSLRRLDLSNCSGISVDALGLLARPRFQKLRWLGVGCTRLSSKVGNGLKKISNDRPGLIICTDGCEIGCRDGWQLPHSY